MAFLVRLQALQSAKSSNFWITREKKRTLHHRAWSNNYAFQPKKYASEFNLFYLFISFNHFLTL